jgi:hypothetical protein
MSKKRKSGGWQIIDGRASLVADGQRLTSIYSETNPAGGLHRRNLQMAAAGVRVFVLIVRGGQDRKSVV